MRNGGMYQLGRPPVWPHEKWFTSLLWQLLSNPVVLIHWAAFSLAVFYTVYVLIYFAPIIQNTQLCLLVFISLFPVDACAELCTWLLHTCLSLPVSSSQYSSLVLSVLESLKSSAQGTHGLRNSEINPLNMSCVFSPLLNHNYQDGKATQKCIFPVWLFPKDTLFSVFN